jgi:hypothetical protein
MYHHSLFVFTSMIICSIYSAVYVQGGTGGCCSLGPAQSTVSLPLPCLLRSGSGGGHATPAAASVDLLLASTPGTSERSAKGLPCPHRRAVQVRQTLSHDFPIHSSIPVTYNLPCDPYTCWALVTPVLEFLFNLLFRGLDECCVKLKAESTDQC